MPELHVPAGWRVRGELSNLPATLGETDLDMLEEDLLQITDPSGSVTLDVGWYPACNAAGEFVCKMIDANDWEAPMQEFSTRALTDVYAWIDESVESLVERYGEPTELTSVEEKSIRVILRIAPRLADEDATGERAGPKPQLPKAVVSSQELLLAS